MQIAICDDPKDFSHNCSGFGSVFCQIIQWLFAVESSDNVFITSFVVRYR